jgi:hypothetical protein
MNITSTDKLTIKIKNLLISTYGTTNKSDDFMWIDESKTNLTNCQDHNDDKQYRDQIKILDSKK